MPRRVVTTTNSTAYAFTVACVPSLAYICALISHFEKMKLFILALLLFLVNLNATSKDLKIITSERSTITVVILDSAAKDLVLRTFNGIQDNNLRKTGTARTYRLTDGRILVEFYDRQAAVISSMDDFKKLGEVTFIKNRVGNLKANISYKIDLTPERAAELLHLEKRKRLPFESESPKDFTIDAYELSTGQILYMERSGVQQWQNLVPDVKTLLSENTIVREQYYAARGEQYEMKQLAGGDPLEDYEPNEHVVYPEYLDAIIKSHELTLLENKVYVSQFHSNLYRARNGYFMLIEELNQKNGAGDRMPVLTLRTYKSLDEVRAKQEQYKKTQKRRDPFRTLLSENI
jgi:hypothetical protein